MCAHVVAVANLNGCLPQFVSAFCKTKKKPDFTKLAVHGMPSGRGKKGTRAPRQRKKTEPVSERVQRISPVPTVAVPESLQVSVSMSNPQTEGELRVHNSPVANSSPSYRPHNSASPFPTYYPNYWTTPYYPMATELERFSEVGCASPVPYTSSTPAPPMAVESTPFYLCFITGNISKCAGCNNKYSKPVVAPHDLCVQHREWRYFTSPG